MRSRPPTRWRLRLPAEYCATVVPPRTPWWRCRRCWGWSNRSLPGSAAAGLWGTTTPAPAPARPTPAHRGASGRSIGVPGVLRMLEIVHNEHGRTAWRDLFGPAVALADGGFDISPRMA